MTRNVDMSKPLLEAVKECVSLCPNNPRCNYLNGVNALGGYGARCVTLHKSGVSFDRSGWCHGAINGAFGDVVAIISWPFTTREKGLTPDVRKKYPYTEEFLDSFYTWLTSSPIFEGVFLEPWNGEYLVINPEAPANHVLYACITSRYPTECIANSIAKVWMDMVAAGVGWPMSLLVPYGLRYGLQLQGGMSYSIGAVSGGGHHMFNRSEMSKYCLAAVVQEMPAGNLRKTHISNPYNKGGQTAKVFDIYGKEKYWEDPLGQFTKDELEVVQIPNGWGTKTEYNLHYDFKAYMDKFIPRVLELQEELLKFNIKPKEAKIA